jgi:hypothetical protein
VKASSRLAVAALAAVVSFNLGAALRAEAHALQPAYLELKLLPTGQYGIVWKCPAAGALPLPISAWLPEGCSPRTAETAIWDGSAYVTRWVARCAGGLEGGRIRIEGLEQTSTDVLVRFELADGVTGARRLTNVDPVLQIPTQPEPLEVVNTYLFYGVKHILLGIDHLLFVLALLMLVRGTRRIVVTITAFTLAHSLTLAAATLGFVHVPGPPIEATIALSIAFVASEIIHGRRGNPGLTERYPWIVSFTFGLLHGFGFAGALAEVGLPQKSIPIALLFFNVGVEIGQLLFLFVVFFLAALGRAAIRSVGLRVPASASAVPPYLVGSVASFWVVQRIVAFFV